eukprot:SAG22_NODE_320_length_12472_cov_2.764002_6_plen_317_part_00
MSLDSIFEEIKTSLTAAKCQVNPYRSIQYGIQFLVFANEQSILIRLFQSKKGNKLDLSQAEHPHLKTLILKTLNNIIKKHNIQLNKQQANVPQKKINTHKEPDTLIGIDESGKGDYFGPLVIAGVYLGKKQREILEVLGVKDSKVLEDKQCLELAPQIKAACPYSLITMGNHSYNELYEKMQNLNHILSWGHAKAIENVLVQQPCDTALSDKFAPQTLIQAALFNKGIKIKLIERTKAESHLAVAAASVVARATYLEEMQKMAKIYQQKFPKGCSDKTLSMAKAFYDKHGKDELACVAKLHFKFTEIIMDAAEQQR